jgi:hypothetical protein
MEFKRAMELLNEIVNTKVEEAGLDAREAAEELLGMGFTVEELIQDFDFDAEDLEDLTSADDDDEDD